MFGECGCPLMRSPLVFSSMIVRMVGLLGRGRREDMDQWTLLLFVVVLAPICEGVWRTSSEERREVRERDMRRGVHYHSKRHMLPNDVEGKKRMNIPNRNRENRKKLNYKPTGHLTPLKEDDIDNDEVVSVAIGPPPMRPMYDKTNWKTRVGKNNASSGAGLSQSTQVPQGAVNMVKDVLSQLGKEFLTHRVSEDFVFGQYVGHALRNISSELKLKFQHEILEVIIKYQRISRGEIVNPKLQEDKTTTAQYKEQKSQFKSGFNDTEESWPDFTNLAKLVG